MKISVGHQAAHLNASCAGGLFAAVAPGWPIPLSPAGAAAALPGSSPLAQPLLL